MPLKPDVTRLHSDHMAPSSLTLGTQRGGLVPCERSKHHPAHPSDEECGWCEPSTVPTLGQLYHAHMRAFALKAYGTPEFAPKPWEELTRSQRKGWEMDADSAVYVHQQFERGFPEWHPLHVPPVADDSDTWTHFGVIP